MRASQKVALKILTKELVQFLAIQLKLLRYRTPRMFGKIEKKRIVCSNSSLGSLGVTLFTQIHARHVGNGHLANYGSHGESARERPRTDR